jgi:arsenate reductase
MKNQRKNKKTVLFLCMHNSSRSQIAEGLLNSIYGNYYQAYSAGTEPQQVNPYAIEVMKELGIDLSDHKSKSITLFQDQHFDYVVTVCDKARETCPFFPGKIILHQSFEDPSTFHGTIEETLIVFRQVRDQIKEWIMRTFAEE